MSSATSTDDRLHPGSHSAREADPGLRPWQFFLLAGMLAATGVVLVSAGQSPASIVVLSLTVVSASLVALGAYRSLAPLVVPGSVEAPQLIVGHTRAALEREKTLVLRAIKDLEFDYAMKKVAQKDFDEMSARLRARAIGLMRQLDTDGGYKEAIEREIAARLRHKPAPSFAPDGATAGKPAPSAPDAPSAPGAPSAPSASASSRDEVSRELRRDLAVAASSREGGPSLCACGTANDHDARFCKTCGAPLAA